MKKSLNLVLIGVLTIASLLLTLPFTPLRNSFSGITSKYIDNTVAKMGVDFNGQIKNARLVTKSRSYKIAGINTDVTTNSKKTTNSGSAYSESNPLKNSGNYSIDANNESNTSKGGATGAIISFAATSDKNSKNKTGIKTNGFTSISSDLTLKGTITKPQTGKPYAVNEGGTHPGVDPTDPPPSLPVGDGLNSLLIFAAIFAAFKIKNSLSI